MIFVQCAYPGHWATFARASAIISKLKTTVRFQLLIGYHVDFNKYSGLAGFWILQLECPYLVKTFQWEIFVEAFQYVVASQVIKIKMGQGSRNTWLWAHNPERLQWFDGTVVWPTDDLIYCMYSTLNSSNEIQFPLWLTFPLNNQTQEMHKQNM